MPLSPAGVFAHHGVVNTAEFFRVIARGNTVREGRTDRRLRRHAGRSIGDQAEGSSPGMTTLLLVDPEHPQQLTARFNTRWASLVARLRASSLDRILAQGRSPESNRFLAVRAQMLVSPVMRRELVQNWENLLVQARRPPVVRDPRVRLNRECIIACESDIAEMLKALLSPLAPARGTAMAIRLLSDGTGPLYNRGRSADLGIALNETIAQLDPFGPTTTAW